MHPKVGSAIRLNRLRSGMTQIQLARAISRSGKFLSEVESGKARICFRDFKRVADVMGISCETLMATASDTVDASAQDAPRRIRDIQPMGLTILTFTQLINHLDRSGWLRGSRMWITSAEPFPEEHDVALVEQLAALIEHKQVSLRYVVEAARLAMETMDSSREAAEVQGTSDAIPTSLRDALHWSQTLRGHLDSGSERVTGYAVTTPLPPLCQSHTVLWVETEDVSWAEVMPLIFCRSMTRTFEKPNESTAFWHHLPREEGSRLLLTLAHQLRPLGRSRSATARNVGAG